MKFQIKKNTAGQYFWVLIARNGETIATSGDYYWNKADCQHGINLVKSTTSASQYEIYQDTQKYWRWRLQATNNAIIAVSSESYATRQGAEHSVALAVSTNASTPVEDLTVTTYARY